MMNYNKYTVDGFANIPEGLVYFKIVVGDQLFSGKLVKVNR